MHKPAENFEAEKKEPTFRLNAVITIACLSFFPLVYFVGKAVQLWVG